VTRKAIQKILSKEGGQHGKRHSKEKRHPVKRKGEKFNRSRGMTDQIKKFREESRGGQDIKRFKIREGRLVGRRRGERGWAGRGGLRLLGLLKHLWGVTTCQDWGRMLDEAGFMGKVKQEAGIRERRRKGNG